MQLRTVVCPIDFTPLTDFEMRLAVEVCETFDARLVLHHNLATAGPGFAKAWEWDEAHQAPKSEPDAERRLAALLEQLPESLRARSEARVSRGAMGLELLHLIRELKADLLLLGSHGWTSEDHASLSEQLIESSPCPVLTFQEGCGERPFRLRGAAGEHVLVPTDFSDSAADAVAYAFELARAAPLSLDLLHVQSGRVASHVPLDGLVETAPSPQSTAALARRRLEELIPADLAEQVSCHVETGAADDGIVMAAKRYGSELIVMGEHARGFFKRYFTRSTARQLLHRAPCPVWFVPHRHAA